VSPLLEVFPLVDFVRQKPFGRLCVTDSELSFVLFIHMPFFKILPLQFSLMSHYPLPQKPFGKPQPNSLHSANFILCTSALQHFDELIMREDRETLTPPGSPDPRGYVV